MFFFRLLWISSRAWFFCDRKSFDVRAGTEKKWNVNLSWPAFDAWPSRLVEWVIDCVATHLALFLRHQTKHRIESERDSFAVHWIQLATLLCHRYSIYVQERRTTNERVVYLHSAVLCVKSDFIFTGNWRSMAESFTTNHDKNETKFFISCVGFCTISHLTPSREKFLFALFSSPDESSKAATETSRKT